MLRLSRYLTWCASVAIVAACSGSEPSPASTDNAAPPAAPSATTGEQTPDPGGTVITVKLMTDDKGNNRFDPADVAAKTGDVVRYTLESGVHNVHFVADSNVAGAALPSASELLQLPGQTYDVKVSMAPGRYYFQCDPHALLGMTGHLTVAAR